MSQQMIVWCAIAGVLLFAFVLRAIEVYCRRHCGHKAHKRVHVFAVGSEKDMFYVPGDVDDDDTDEL